MNALHSVKKCAKIFIANVEHNMYVTMNCKILANLKSEQQFGKLIVNTQWVCRNARRVSTDWSEVYFGTRARAERAATQQFGKLTSMVGIVKWLRHRVVAPVYVGSNPTIHPINVGVSPSGKAMDSDSIMRRFESCYPSQLKIGYCFSVLYIWRHSQVVRQRSAKPLFPSSNLGVASIKLRDTFCVSQFF